MLRTSTARRAARSRMSAVLAVVALTAAACGDDGGGGDDSQVSLRGTDALEFEPETLSASAGTLTVELTSEGASEHTFVIEELDDTEVVAAAAGETATGTVEVETGSYTYYCSVPGHRESGMEGELTVS